MNKIPLALVILVAATAGCVSPFGGDGGPVVVSQTQGVVFKSVNVTSPVFENDEVSVDFIVQNIGGKTSTNTMLQVFGNDWFSTSGDDSGNGNQPFWFTVGSGVLDRPDVAAKIPSPIEEESITFTTPSIISQQQTFKWTSRLYYKYTGTAKGSSTAISETEFKRQQREQSIDFTNDITETVSPGPIQMRVLAQNPIVVKQATREVPVRIEFSNVGGGRVFTNDSGSYNRASYEKIGLNDYDTVIIESITADIGAIKNEATCQPGKKHRIIVPLTCRIVVNTSVVNVPETALVVTTDISYGYQVDKDFSITVKKLFGGE